MRLGAVRIQGLRCIQDLRVDLHHRITALMGTNNCGKTTVLEAIAAILNHRRGTVAFTEADLRGGAGEINITLHVLPDHGQTRFRSGELRDLSAEVGSDGDEKMRLRLRVFRDRDPSLQDLRSELHQVDADGIPVGADIGGFPFREAMPFRSFGIERDVRRGTAARWSDWGRVLSSAGPEGALLDEVVKAIRDAGTRLVGETEALQKIQDELGSILGTLGLPVASKIDLVAALSDPEALVRQLSLEIFPNRSDRAYSAERHGMGTQGALLFAIYELFVRQVLRAAETDSNVSPVLTVEEIETHLHPTAQRAIARRLATLPGQTIVTTHSPEIIRALSKDRLIVLLRATAAGTQCGFVEHNDRFVFDHARTLFARCVIITEGFEDQVILAVATSMGVDLAADNIEVVNADGQGNVSKLWSIIGPHGYQIPTVCVADSDQRSFLETFVKLLRGDASSTKEHPPSMTVPDLVLEVGEGDYFTPAAGGCLETELIATRSPLIDEALCQDKGYDTLDAWRTSQSSNKVTTPRKTTLGELNDDDARHFWLSKSKEKIASVFADVLKKSPSSAPAYLVAAIHRAQDLARSY